MERAEMPSSGILHHKGDLRPPIHQRPFFFGDADATRTEILRQLIRINVCASEEQTVPTGTLALGVPVVNFEAVPPWTDGLIF
jgi:hypothetical protein